MTETLSKDQHFIRKLTDIVIANLQNENFRVRELAKESGFSRYILGQRLNTICRKTAIQFIREVRLEKALEMLNNEAYTAAEVAFKTGFGSPAYFNKCFHEYFGYPPGKVAKGNSDTEQTEVLSSAFDKDLLKKSWMRTHIFSFQGILLLIMLSGATGYLIFKKMSKPESAADLLSPKNRITIAVMPFQNMTRDTIWNIWQYGIQESLISSFSNTGDLKVRQRESVNILLKSRGISEYAGISIDIAGKISQKLDADMYICGSILKSGTSVRIDAQVIDVKSGEVLKSIEVYGAYEDSTINQVIDSLRIKMTDFLIVTKLLREDPLLRLSFSSPSKSPEAFRYYIIGIRASENLDFATARKFYLKALTIDSTLWAAAIHIINDYNHEGNAEQNLTWVLKLYEKRDQMPLLEQLWVNWAYACNFEAPEVAIKFLKQLKEIDESPGSSYLLGYTYMTINQYDKAIPEYERSVELCRKWGIKPDENFSFYGLLYGYYKAGQFKKHKKLMKEMIKYMPNEPNVIFWQAIIALTEKDTVTSNECIKKFVAKRKANSISDADIAFEMADNFADMGFPDKAEENFRKALSLDPDNPRKLITFARFLIANNRKLEEVPGLMDKAMNIAPGKLEYYKYMDAKGWSLFNLGKIQQAQEILQKTFAETPFPLYSIKSHLDEVKNANARPI